MDLEIAKTDEDGHVVHAECYLGKIMNTTITPEQRDMIRNLCARIVDERDPKAVIELSEKLNFWLTGYCGDSRGSVTK